MNALAIKILHCGLGPNEHNKIMCCKSSKQIWDLLEVTHEGTNEVKRLKIDLLMSKYERFGIKPRENIQDIFTRFTNTNELVSKEIFLLIKRLGKYYEASLKMNVGELKSQSSKNQRTSPNSILRS